MQLEHPSICLDLKVHTTDIFPPTTRTERFPSYLYKPSIAHRALYATLLCPEHMALLAGLQSNLNSLYRLIMARMMIRTREEC